MPMRMPSPKTLKKYRLTLAEFSALYESQRGCCAICGISEPELERQHSDAKSWQADRVLHIDHEHGSTPCLVRGLLCSDCNFDLEAYIKGRPIAHPGRRGVSHPREDPRFAKYLRMRRDTGPE